MCAYKSRVGNERVFRSMKWVDLRLRPIRHRVAERVRAHAFLWLLALLYLVRGPWAPLTEKTRRTPAR